jgi:hypothetical protein
VPVPIFSDAHMQVSIVDKKTFYQTRQSLLLNGLGNDRTALIRFFFKKKKLSFFDERHQVDFFAEASVHSRLL